jgi:hypothetical protein
LDAIKITGGLIMPKKGFPEHKIVVTGLPLKNSSAEHQIIAILTKKLGGEVLFSLKEADKITGFCMQVTPQGNILLKAE